MFNSNDANAAEENEFRKRYADELRKKKETEGSISSLFGLNELSEERARVKKQALMTPGRRGEQIKNEEIDKEILRRVASSPLKGKA